MSTIFLIFFHVHVCLKCAWDACLGPWLSEPNFAYRAQPSPITHRPLFARLPGLTWDLQGLCWYSCKLSWALLGPPRLHLWGLLDLGGVLLSSPGFSCALLWSPGATLGSPELSWGPLGSPEPAWARMELSRDLLSCSEFSWDLSGLSGGRP